MDKLKQWVALTVVGVLAVLAAGWFLLVSPKRSNAADLRSQATTQDSANDQLRAQLAALKAQAKDEPAQEAKLAAVSAKIPDNPALPALIRALTKASDATGVDVKSLSPGAPAPVTAPAPAVAATRPTAVTGAAPAVAVPGAAAGSAAAGTLAQIPVTMQVSGSYFQVLEFMDQLESFTRAFKVTALAMNPDSSEKAGAGTSLGASITGSVYMAAGRLPVPTVNVPKTGK